MKYLLIEIFIKFKKCHVNSSHLSQKDAKKALFNVPESNKNRFLIIDKHEVDFYDNLQEWSKHNQYIFNKN